VKRISHYLTGAISLAIAVASIVFWTHSYFVWDSALYADANGNSFEAQTWPGILRLSLYRNRHPSNSGAFIDSIPLSSLIPSNRRDARGYYHDITGWGPPETGKWVHFGFGISCTRWIDGRSNFVVAVPFWFLALLCALPPALVVRGAMRRRGTMISGKCRRCGYDLRATPDRCPECGNRT
jgi:hypothetical protein